MAVSAGQRRSNVEARPGWELMNLGDQRSAEAKLTELLTGKSEPQRYLETSNWPRAHDRVGKPLMGNVMPLAATSRHPPGSGTSATSAGTAKRAFRATRAAHAAVDAQSVNMLKTELYEAIKGSSAGEHETATSAAKIDDLVKKLSASPGGLSFSEALADGDWTLVFTRNADGSPRVQKFTRTKPGRTFANFQVSKGEFENIVELLGGKGRLTATVKFAPDAKLPERISCDITRAGFSLFGLRMPLPLRAKGGWLDFLYLDEEMRITRGNRGGVFVHVRPKRLEEVFSDGDAASSHSAMRAMSSPATALGSRATTTFSPGGIGSTNRNSLRALRVGKQSVPSRVITRAAAPALADTAAAAALTVPSAEEAAMWSRFEAWLTSRGVNISAVTLAKPSGMRGLVATRDIAEGESIIEVPLAAAIQVADDTAPAHKDPSAAALTFLRLYREQSTNHTAYFDLIPGRWSEDMSTMPDFFSEQEIDLLQHPCAERTRRRQQLCRDRAAEFGLEVEDVTWAVSTVTQRSFTVLSPLSGMISVFLPGIDMINHDAESLHSFKVTWTFQPAFGGTFRVVAGSPITKGEEVRICYGGSPLRPDGCDGECKGDVAWTNDQYLQRYGFVDKSFASTIVDGKFLDSERGAAARAALSQTTAEADEALLQEADLSVAARTAIDFRLHMKRALAAQQASQALLRKTGDAGADEYKEAKPHILPENVKAQLRMAGVAYDDVGEADSRG